MPLEAAMVLRLSGLYPLMILTFVDNEEKYSNKLRYYYMNLELMNFESPTCLGECQSVDQKNHGKWHTNIPICLIQSAQLLKLFASNFATMIKSVNCIHRVIVLDKDVHRA